VSEIHFIEGRGHDIALTRSASFMLDKEDAGSLTGSAAPAGAKPSAPLPNQLIRGVNGIMPWGDSNNFPQEVIRLYYQDPIIPQTLAKMVAMLLGRGIMPVTQTIDEEGKEKNIPIPDPEIWHFLRSPGTRYYLNKGASDMVWFFNVFPELILSKDRSVIAQLHCNDASYCRYSEVNKAGKCDNVFINANWPNAQFQDNETIIVPTVDPLRWDKVEWMMAGSDFKYIYPLSIPTPGKTFYQLAHHDTIRQSGWLDVHLAVPQFKKFLMQNQMTLKYHFKVDREFWKVLFGTKQWAEMSPAQQSEKKREWLTSVEKSLTDVSKTGNSILTDMEWDPDKGAYRDYIQVVAVNDAMKDGKYIVDNLEAAANIFYAIGMDPAQVGFAGGENMGSRSGGSDKREAFLIALAMMQPYRDRLLELLDFVALYNGWHTRHENLTFVFRDTVLTTLDQGKGTQKVLS
jgi:hypothetical protein